MALRCNIDERGARVRRVWGVMMLLVGAMLAVLAWWSGTWWLWIVVGVCGFMGVMAQIEARKKWCAMRAMGVKTPL